MTVVIVITILVRMPDPFLIFIGYDKFLSGMRFAFLLEQFFTIMRSRESCIDPINCLTIHEFPVVIIRNECTVTMTDCFENIVFVDDSFTFRIRVFHKLIITTSKLNWLSKVESVSHPGAKLMGR